MGGTSKTSNRYYNPIKDLILCKINFNDILHIFSSPKFQHISRYLITTG